MTNSVQGPENQKLVDAQAAAAQMLDRHVSVTAGPGSGKTTVLIERYLRILKTIDISIDQIVAITFTNRAASEMRDRLRRKLDSLISTSDPRDRARWAQQKRRLDGAIITTIHGFCAGLLREFPIESGLDPEFTLLDEHQTVLLEETIAKRTLTDWITSGDPVVSRLTAGIGRIKLASTLGAIYRSIRGQGIPVEALAERTATGHSSAQEYVDALNQVGLVIVDLINTRGLSRVAETKRKTIERNWPALQAKLNLGPSGFDTAAFCRLIEELRTTWRPSAQGTLKPLIQELDRLLWGKDLSGLLPRVWLDFQAREYAVKLAEVTADLERQLKAEKEQKAALDFDDLQTGVLEMLGRHPEVLKKMAARYRYFLVDEFQDTNSLQRDLVKKLALDKRSGVNTFIVGDPKQSIYGFRGADVQVFHEMALALKDHGGESLPLHLNFRSQGPLIQCFNHIFRHVFAAVPELENVGREELGFVAHEDSLPHRGATDAACPVEVLIDTGGGGNKYQSGGPFESPRDRDARQVAARCRQLTAGAANEYDRPSRRFKYSEIAILFRAMTQASIYETVLRRAGIPYQTIQGRGFYDRQEVTDLIQLMRFLDNRTDDIALAAVLRSPICGISDDSLLAIGAESLLRDDSGKPRRRTWSLWSCLLRHARNDLIPDDQRATVARAASVLSELVNVRHGYRVSELLRLAVEKTEYQTIIASSYDGAQGIANIEKLFSLAERFEASSAHNIRDFVRFVADFERSSGREGEGRIDESEDAVRLMTIHQAKGLQFPVVIIPELHRKRQENLDWFILDRQRGLTVKVPDGRSGLATGITMERLRERARWREKFESARLLYVGATRAEDRLILTGSAPDLAASPRGGGEPVSSETDDQETDSDTWLSWICRALGLNDNSLKDQMIEVGEGAAVRLEINLADTLIDYRMPKRRSQRFMGGLADLDLSRTPGDLFPLLTQIDGATGPRTISVTQLTSFTRCPRQYYFSRVLHAPERGELSGWEHTEAPEPPSNLTASLKGSVVHLFCERFADGVGPDICLGSSLDHVLRIRMADRGQGVSGINRDAAIKELRPLVENYLASDVRRRIDSVRGGEIARTAPLDSMGQAVFSEQSFTLKASGKTVRGTIDKLLISRGERGNLEAEIIDFKTNRFRAAKSDALLKAAIESAAAGVRMQMRIYSLAVRELTPGVANVKAMLHFVDPSVEYNLPPEVLEPAVCRQALDDVLFRVDQAAKSESYPPQVGGHCRHCGFLGICQPGRLAVRSYVKG